MTGANKIKKLRSVPYGLSLLLILVDGIGISHKYSLPNLDVETLIRSFWSQSMPLRTKEDLWFLYDAPVSPHFYVGVGSTISKNTFFKAFSKDGSSFPLNASTKCDLTLVLVRSSTFSPSSSIEYLTVSLFSPPL